MKAKNKKGTLLFSLEISEFCISKNRPVFVFTKGESRRYGVKSKTGELFPDS